MKYELNSTKTIATDPDYFWRDIDKDTPRNVKLQLLSKYGIAQHDKLTPETIDYYTHWTPLPRKRDDANT